MKKITIVLLCLCCFQLTHSIAQYEKDSSHTVAPFKIFDNLYYVGTDWASAYLINTKDGLILIDALYGKFTGHIIDAVRELGFDPHKIRYILCSHGHYDHYEGADTLQKITHARIGMTDADWQIAEGKTRNEYESVRSHPKRDLVIADGDSLVLGGMKIHFFVTPGHTLGVLSMSFPVRDSDKQYQAFMFGGVGLNFHGVAQTEMYLNSVARISRMQGIEVNLSNHPGPGKILKRAALLKTRKAGEINPFVAPGDFTAWLNELRKNAEIKLAEEKKSKTAARRVIQFIFCSDIHLGLTRPVFRNRANVSAADVSAAMIEQMNLLPSVYLPDDGGVSSGEKTGGIERVIITGDICNRQEAEAQSATISWKQFGDDYMTKLHLLTRDGNKTGLLLTPGNHDISNAIGFHRPMQPLTDNAAMVGMYNLEMHPATAKTAGNFDFQKDKIHYSENIGGIHFVLVSAWPDSSERVWMQKDLAQVPATMPTFLFTHSDPVPEARFFQNPNGDHSINETDKFENLVTERFKDGLSVKDNTLIEQRGFVSFLQAHPNIKAYFHGHTNYAEFYDWKGPDNTISLPCFRADSPMKGRVSAKDETKISFNLVSIDTEKKLMTVRECFWNAHPAEAAQKIEWGMMRTISF